VERGLCCSTVTLKNPSFLEKGAKNGGKQTNSRKKVIPEKGKTFV
jgi:hypothetical protein